MTVPVHNLYDFVHQTTKNKYFLIYFYPWGQKSISNTIFHQSNWNYLNSAKGIAINNRFSRPINSVNDLEYSWVARTQPAILCHDQEPLNFVLYEHGTEYTEQGFQFWKNRIGLPLSEEVKKINLRLSHPFSLQKTWILLHSELNSPELKLYEDTGQFCGAYWWSHAVIARDWYRYAEHDLSLKPANISKKIFLSYCRDTTGSRQYRQEFLDLISHNGISDQCQTQSFDGVDHGAESSAVYNSEDFNNTAISIVLETVFDSRIHLTEKILRPIACGHPFILAAGPGSLKLLKSYGFHTFAGYINESYDDIQDAQERLAAIVTEMKRIANLPTRQLEYLIKMLRSIAESNRRRFFSQEFHQQVVNELERNVDAAFSTHNGELDFDLWWSERQWRKHLPGPKWKQLKHLSPLTDNVIPMYRQQRLARRIKREQ
jgi:hypothetical protein